MAASACKVLPAEVLDVREPRRLVRYIMRYLLIETGGGSERPIPWWCRVLSAIFPAANPDLEDAYASTAYWWLEIGQDGAPVREIGFDENGVAVVLGPLGRNVGFLIDSADDWSSSTSDSETAAAEFEREWGRLYPRFQHLDVA